MSECDCMVCGAEPATWIDNERRWCSRCLALYQAGWDAAVETLKRGIQGHREGTVIAHYGWPAWLDKQRPGGGD